jgi:hypothetical protein
MGLIDYLERPKWTPEDWLWQRDTLCILKTAGDRRSFSSGESLAADLLISHFGDAPLEGGVLTVVVEEGGGSGDVLATSVRRDISRDPGTLEKVLSPSLPAPDVAVPTRFVIRAELRAGRETFRNRWPIWVLPRPDSVPLPPVLLHGSFPPELAAADFQDVPKLGAAGAGGADSGGTDPEGIVLAARLDDRLMDRLEAGGRVLLLADGQKGSFPLSNHWFLRGAPYVPAHPLLRTLPRDFFIELQHFDLAGPVIPQIEYLEEISPILMLWDTHDLDFVKTHGLLFETRFQRGRLLVSALRHGGEGNAAGRWLLRALIRHLASGPEPARALAADTRRRMREKLHEEKISLTDRVWRFAPDPEDDGLAKGWHLPSTPDESWRTIRIGRHWEAQGYPLLDGWAWYRIQVDVPRSWAGREVYLSFEGADDFYELYVNGKLAGTGGDLEKRQTAFDERKSHRITGLVKPGATCHIAVRIHDWQGAGGLFRPITLGTVGLGAGFELLK